MDERELGSLLQSMGAPAALMKEIAGSMRSLYDPSATEAFFGVREPMFQLYDAILESSRNLQQLRHSLKTPFEDTDYVTSNLSGEGFSTGFFPALHETFAKGIKGVVDSYIALAQEYSTHVEPYRSRLDRLGSVEDVYDIDGVPGKLLERAVSTSMKLLKSSSQSFIDAKVNFPRILEAAHKNFAGYEKYLRDRFIKSDEEKSPSNLREMLRAAEEHKNGTPRGEYVKVQLVEGNSVLTDILLEVVDGIPGINKRSVREDGGKREEKHISAFAVGQSANTLSALADPRMMEYVEDPQKFFARLGTAFTDFNAVLERLQPYHLKILDSGSFAILGDNSGDLKEKILKSNKKAQKDLATVRSMDLDNIIQNSEDVLPDNRKEQEYAAHRQKTFDVLLGGIRELSQIGDPYERIERAKEIVLDAVAHKDEMNETIRSATDRKLKKDRQGDNEYYEGGQEGYGTFVFKRAPTPNVKMEEVIGKSFIKAKRHLDQIIETGAFPRLMQTTAPGGKVRSNMILIGPYGCGKTELARAVCGDERVIGAQASVAGTLTAFMHESVNNVRRIYDSARELRRQAGETKPVMLILDEFDSWFEKGSAGFSSGDMQQIETTLSEILDGMGDYHGIITIGMTNKPKQIPKRIARRFRHIDVVGQLTSEERQGMLKMFLEQRLPVGPGVEFSYEKWAEKLEDAPGDVVRKVVDEVHFGVMPDFIRSNPEQASTIERLLQKRERTEGVLDKKDQRYVIHRLKANGICIEPGDIDIALSSVLEQPQIQMQIKKARQVYANARTLLDNLSDPDGGFDEADGAWA